MKRRVVIYLEQEEIRKLIEKAKEAGFQGRGAISYYIEKIIKEPICFLDWNVKALLSSISLK